MSDCFQRNAEVLQRRWPTLFTRLLAEDSQSIRAEQVTGKGATLSIDGIQLTSRHDRFAEARLQAASLPLASSIAHVYGTGLGDVQRVLLERSDLNRLQVHILNGALFKLILEQFDQVDWLSEPRVELSYAVDDREIRLPFFALPSELELADELNAKIRDRLVSEVHLNFNNREFNPQSPQILKRLKASLQLLRSDRNVTELFGSQAGREIYVIGTGPSLEQQFEKLKVIRAQSPRPLFISVDTAYRPLMEQGIKPDMVVSIDQRITALHLPSEQSDKIPLVYMPLSNPKVLRAWKGWRYASYSASPIYRNMREKNDRGELYVGGSVIHPAVDLAVKMGAAQITLFGADFAFPMNKTHASWKDGELGPGVNLARHWVLDGRGQRVKTQLNFRRYLSELERYIAKHPQVSFFNSSREGAMIAGTRFNPEFTQ
ncbi:motility associated factor glycosyltransferase family protein [Pseudomonas sp. NA-150]|uniref:motility associated factor glycosyltransferase family protein n=1 Tax=Pseudomonas sp. NA-150 TaxID=3367525 RepID=UPI0037CB27AA